ncbi:MAG TPA: 3'-5' exonuclease [Candidatus Krumholzibacteria bacterium]
MKDVATLILDTETGGLEDRHPTIELAAIAVRGWEEVAQFERRIRFDEAACDPEALKLNSYDPDVWALEAIPPMDALADFARWCSDYADVEKVSRRTGGAYKVARCSGWNVAFDCRRLERGFKASGMFLPADTYQALDWLQVARGYFWDAEKRPENLKLTTVAEWFGIPTDGAHGALADCRLTLGVARRLTVRD